MAHRLFLSYRRADSAGQAARLAEDLGEVFGEEHVFIDIADLTAGRPFPQEIEAALDQADALLVVIGPRWLEHRDEGRRIDDPTDWVRREVGRALGLAKPTLPVLVGGALLPRSDSLPAEIARLTESTAVEVTDSRWRYDVGRLFGALADLGIVPPVETAYPGETVGRVEARGAWLGARDPGTTRAAVLTSLRANRVTVHAEAPDAMALVGGSRTRTRLLGMLLTRPVDWPIRGKLRLTERGPWLQVEILVGEDWGAGVFDSGTGGRYRARLEKIVSELRAATGG